MSIVLTQFARTRLFPRDGRRNAIQDCTPEQFIQRLNDEPPLRVIEGYAPFCQLHVHRNWTSTRCLTIPVTDDNRHLLRSGYEARSPQELAVLVRWFEGVEPPVAAYLLPILYSRDQLARKARPSSQTGVWSVVSTPQSRTKFRWHRSPCCAMPWAWKRAARARRWTAMPIGVALRSGSAMPIGVGECVAPVRVVVRQLNCAWHV